MTLASFIDYLKAIPVTEVTSEKADLLPEKQRYIIDSIGEDGPGNKVTEVTSKNNEGATEKREFSEFAPVWVAPAPPPQPVALPVPVTPAALAVPGCSNCEAATTKQWHGGYTMQCVGCMARLVLSARPSRQQQETMLACLELQGNGRPDRPTRQQVLERLQRR